MRTRAAVILAYLIAVGALGFGVWVFALTASLGQLAERGRADLSLASDRLVNQLQSYRELAVLLADHPVLLPLLTGGAADVAAAETVLLRTADMTGSLEIMLIDPEGAVVAQSHGFENDMPRNLREKAYFKRAMQGGLGSLHAQFGTRAQRSFTFAAPVFGPDRKVAGAVAVSVDLETVETDWRASAQTVFFTDPAGVVFVSNRAELLYLSRKPLTASGTRGSPLIGEYRDEDIKEFLPFRSIMRGGEELWVQSSVSYLPTRAVHVTQPLPLMNLQGELLLQSRDAERLALFQALVVMGLGLILGGALFYLAERRRAMLERLEIEAAANAQLEARVAERTAALQQAQADLVQAGKLSALGQMSAGISHELNQPLMAIRSYADNAEEFLRRGKPEIAGQNLGRIGELAHRMGRIIKNLRAFARQETEPVGRVELGAVINAALDLSQARLRAEEVTLIQNRPDGPVFVQGGEVRLQQVLINLLSNAIDALEGQPDKRIEITVVTGEAVTMSVRDTGPGLADPEQIFDPFYSTKEVGKSEGMGLGLSISYGIVQSCGGDIKGRNHPDGGAIVTVELPRASEMEDAA